MITIKTQNYSFLNIVERFLAEFPEMGNEITIELGMPSKVRFATTNALARVIAGVELWIMRHERYLQTMSTARSLTGMRRTHQMLERHYKREKQA